jgi:hypothetical protein
MMRLTFAFSLCRYRSLPKAAIHGLRLFGGTSREAQAGQQGPERNAAFGSQKLCATENEVRNFQSRLHVPMLPYYGSWSILMGSGYLAFRTAK